MNIRLLFPDEGYNGDVSLNSGFIKQLVFSMIQNIALHTYF